MRHDCVCVSLMGSVMLAEIGIFAAVFCVFCVQFRWARNCSRDHHDFSVQQSSVLHMSWLNFNIKLVRWRKYVKNPGTCTGIVCSKNTCTWTHKHTLTNICKQKHRSTMCSSVHIPFTHAAHILLVRWCLQFFFRSSHISCGTWSRCCCCCILCCVKQTHTPFLCVYYVDNLFRTTQHQVRMIYVCNPWRCETASYELPLDPASRWIG